MLCLTQPFFAIIEFISPSHLQNDPFFYVVGLNGFYLFNFIMKVMLAFHQVSQVVYTYFPSLNSRFLGNIKDAFVKNPDLKNLLLDDFFMQEIHKCQVVILLS